MPEVVLSVAPNPKRRNSGAWHRYAGYYVGATEADLLARGVTAADVRFDRKSGFVVFGDGERREPPAEAPEPLGAPAQRSPTTRAVPESPAASSPGATPAPTALETPRVRTESAHLSTSPPAPDKPAHWWRGCVRVEAAAGERDESGSRTWTITAHLPDGRALVREVRGDRTAQNMLWTATLHGVDPDDWRSSP